MNNSDYMYPCADAIPQKVKTDEDIKAFNNFKEKMMVQNPNLSFRLECWYMDSDKIITTCTKHDLTFVKIKEDISSDCPFCKKLSWDNKEEVINDSLMKWVSCQIM